MIDCPTDLALDDLKLERVLIAYPGRLRYTVAQRVDAVPLTELIRGDSPN